MDGEFKGKTEEAISTVKQDIAEVRESLKSMDKRIWLILLLVAITVANGGQGVASDIIGKVLAFAR